MNKNDHCELREELIKRDFPIRPEFRKRDAHIREEVPSGLLVIRLKAETSSLEQDGFARSLESFAKRYKLQGLLRVLDNAKDPDTHRLVQSVDAERILELEKRASRGEFAPLRSMTQYWRVDLRGKSPEESEAILKSLRELPEVEAAWQEQLASLPAVVPGNDVYNSGQSYQDAAPMGIDARWMWTQPNGEGAGVGVIDIEGGWLTTHEDLTGKSPTLIHGVHYSSWVDHGTAVLGEIVASDNTVGVVGSAPAVSSIRMCSIYDSTGTQNVPDALAAAIDAMSAGEIMLIELQTGYKPIEIYDDRLDLIRLATALGIIVVEAAGNGNYDLDAWSTGGLQRLNRGSADFVDSGAIMVGACKSALPHDRWEYSNYGSRIDCFAWGENVVTTGYGDLDDGGGDANKEYTDTFQGTSSASPIIVSAAALVQSNYQAASGTMLSPGQMRVILSNPATGTAQGAGTAGAIGVMPDLAAIVPTLGVVPDVYVRDAVGDTGVIPWGGAISSSPDVIVLPAAEADPDAAFGEGSGSENSNTIGYEVESGQDNTIYVRLRNRGGAVANNVIATVYWSEVSTLVTPSMWNEIGSVTIPTVPVGDVLTVSPAVTWAKADIPSTGHYCFVATLQHPNDPAPPIPGPMDWDQFKDMIRAHNNVTWRNFNVINDLPDAPDSTPNLAFQIAGAEDQARLFAFEIERRLPGDAVLELEGPFAMLDRMRGDSPWKLVRSRCGKTAQLILPSQPRIDLSRIRIPRGGRIPFKFNLTPGKEKVQFGHGVMIRQLDEDGELGRVAWQFSPKFRPCHQKADR